MAGGSREQDSDDLVTEEADEAMLGPIGGETGSQVGRKSLTGMTCSLKTLIDDDVLQPGVGVLHMSLLEKSFVGDLLANGAIRWAETKQMFSTPSAWVNYCRRSVDPNSGVKAASAWSTIRYKGKRLDSYKLRWYRRQKKIISNANMMELNQSKIGKQVTDSDATCDQAQNFSRLTACDSEKLRAQNVVEHSILGLRSHPVPDPSVMVRCTPFSAMERIQPFTINVSTNALLLVDFHCHLTDGEVTGYLSGSWDFATHCLTIVQAFPCRSRLGDRKRSALVEEEIRTNMEQRNLTLVGWYHSHPHTAPHPTLRDMEQQLDYQIAMKGESEVTYTPCVALICSPYDQNSSSPESSMQLLWMMPPPEYRPYEYGRPMQMLFSVTRDSYLTQDLLLEMRLLAHFYTSSPDAVKFLNNMPGHETSFWDKLKLSLAKNLPRDLMDLTHGSGERSGQSLAQAQVQQQALAHFWAFLNGLLVS